MRPLAMIVLASGPLWAGTKDHWPVPVFVYNHHPDEPLERFAAGELGIIPPGYARIYLYIVYRHLIDRPLSKTEQALWMGAWRLRRPVYTEPGTGTGQTHWDSQRRVVTTPPAPRRVVERGSVPGGNWIYYFPLCADHAYETAAVTLRARIARFGLASREVRYWVTGQDAVLATCETTKASDLAAPPPELPPLLQADRAYQRAAMAMYAFRFDDAIEQFRKIAADAQSPWRLWAPYLVGRSLIWKARTTQNDRDRAKWLDEAEQQLRTVLSDRRLAVSHLGAEWLYVRCLLATKPRVGVERLGTALLRPGMGPLRAEGLYLYLGGLDDLMSDGAYGNKPPTQRAGWPRDELSQWLLTIQNGNYWSYRHAVDQWRRTRSKAWLYAALWKARADAAEGSELLAAAMAVSIDHPAGPAFHYLAARLHAFSGDAPAARKEIESVLPRVDRLPSAKNQVLALRTLVAETLADFLRDAPRKAVRFVDIFDGAEFGGYDYGEIRRQRREIPLIDRASEHVFTRCLPLSVLRQIVLMPDALPAHIHKELVLMTWTRAMILGRFDLARELAPRLGTLFPKLQGRFEAFARSEDPKADAAFLLLDLPGARPYMNRGLGRQLALDQLDRSWNRNWWYRFNEEDMHGLERFYLPISEPSEPMPRVAFVTEPQRRDVDQEWTAMSERGEQGLEWIASRVVKAIDRRPAAERAAILLQVVSASSGNMWATDPAGNRPRPGLRAAVRILETRYSTYEPFRKWKEWARPYHPDHFK